MLIIGGKRKILQKAKAFGLQTALFQKSRLLDPRALPYADHVVTLDYERTDELLAAARACHAAAPIDYVISFTEPGLLPAAIVNDALGLAGNSLETVSLLKDKWAMRQQLNRRGVSPVRAALGRSADDLRAFARTVGLPMIVKPIDGAGSFSVIAIHALDDIPAAWAALRANAVTQTVIEELLSGPEISVEAVSSGGRHLIIALTAKRTLPNFVEIGHAIPAPLDPQTQAEVCALVRQFLDVVGLREGPTHTEIKLTPHGPRIVESHNRVGGGKIVELARLVYDIDMIQLSLGLPFGLAELPRQPPPPRGGAAIRFFTPPPGIVRAIEGLDEARQAEGVIEVELELSVGSRTPPIRHSPDRRGHVLAIGASVEEAIARCERLTQTVRLTIDEDSQV
jgi:biotin carboxylase